MIKKINNLNTRKKKGFSLIEMLVVMAIMAVLATITILPYRQYQNRKNLDLASQEIKSAITEALNNSLAPTGNNVDGYGVYINKNNNSYFLFADRNSNNLYDNWGDQIIKNYNFYPNVEIQSLNPDRFNDNKVSVLFTTPQNDPDLTENNPGLPYKRETLIDAVTPTSGEMNIKIKLTDSTLTKEIILNTYTNNVYVK